MSRIWRESVNLKVYFYVLQNFKFRSVRCRARIFWKNLIFTKLINFGKLILLIENCAFRAFILFVALIEFFNYYEEYSLMFCSFSTQPFWNVLPDRRSRKALPKDLQPEGLAGIAWFYRSWAFLQKKDKHKVRSCLP